MGISSAAAAAGGGQGKVAVKLSEGRNMVADKHSNIVRCGNIIVAMELSEPCQKFRLELLFRNELAPTTKGVNSMSPVMRALPYPELCNENM